MITSNYRKFLQNEGMYINPIRHQRKVERIMRIKNLFFIPSQESSTVFFFHLFQFKNYMFTQKL